MRKGQKLVSGSYNSLNQAIRDIAFEKWGITGNDALRIIVEKLTNGELILK